LEFSAVPDLAQEQTEIEHLEADLDGERNRVVITFLSQDLLFRHIISPCLAIRRTPINEFSQSSALFSLAFSEWCSSPENERMGLSHRLLKDNPHIAAWDFHARNTLPHRIVLKPQNNRCERLLASLCVSEPGKPPFSRPVPVRCSSRAGYGNLGITEGFRPPLGKSRQCRQPRTTQERT
jgi:hypothetical protein